MKSFGTSRAELNLLHGRAKLVLPMLMTKKEVQNLKIIVKYVTKK